MGAIIYGLVICVLVGVIVEYVLQTMDKTIIEPLENIDNTLMISSIILLICGIVLDFIINDETNKQQYVDNYITISMKTITVISQYGFDQLCMDNSWDDTNVDNLNYAFISIIGTEACNKYYLEEDVKHWFDNSHTNVLNLEFDDIAYDTIDWKGHTFSGMTDEQAKQTVEFINKNSDKNFIIHCRAGFSRSQAVGRFINDIYKNEFISTTLLETYNRYVYSKLVKVYRDELYKDE